jgi:hypothetical protein
VRCEFIQERRDKRMGISPTGRSGKGLGLYNFRRPWVLHDFRVIPDSPHQPTPVSHSRTSDSSRSKSLIHFLHVPQIVEGWRAAESQCHRIGNQDELVGWLIWPILSGGLSLRSDRLIRKSQASTQIGRIKYKYHLSCLGCLSSASTPSFLLSFDKTGHL